MSLALTCGLRSSAGIKHLLGEQPAENFPPCPGGSPPSRWISAVTVSWEGSHERRASNGLAGQSHGPEFKSPAPSTGDGLAPSPVGSLDDDEFLLDLTEQELHQQAANRLQRRLREAKFPLLKTLEPFVTKRRPVWNSGWSDAWPGGANISASIAMSSCWAKAAPARLIWSSA
jgi:hypothetical protein